MGGRHSTGTAIERRRASDLPGLSKRPKLLLIVQFEDTESFTTVTDIDYASLSGAAFAGFPGPCELGCIMRYDAGRGRRICVVDDQSLIPLRARLAGSWRPTRPRRRGRGRWATAPYGEDEAEGWDEEMSRGILRVRISSSGPDEGALRLRAQ